MDSQFMMWLLLNNMCFILGLTAFGYLCYSIGKNVGGTQKGELRKKRTIISQPLLDPVIPYSEDKIEIPIRR